MTSFRPVLFILGILSTAMAVSMSIPMAVDMAVGQRDWMAFAASGLVSGLFGGILIVSTKAGPVTLNLRQGFLLTTSSWFVLSALGAMPFMISGPRLDFADAFFEASSGLTTTGSTVLTNLDSMPAGILLWRAMLQWMGGIGIIAMAVAILPYLSVGGMQLFRMESSDRSEKILPSAAQLASTTVLAYVTLNVLCALAYRLAGMTTFEAITHSMTTISTGGYSTSDASLGHFQSPAIEWIATVFMTAGALPFVAYIRAVRERPAALWRESQVRSFLAGLGLAVLTLALWIWLARGEAFADALRLAAFNVVSIVTTTGFANVDYSQWGGFVTVFLLILTFVGGCTGSTAGGIKVMRFQIADQMIRSEMMRLIYPHGVIPVKYAGHTVSSDVTLSVANFLFIYFAAFVFLSIGLGSAGLDFLTAVSGAATALGNVGPGLGPIIGPAGNFSTLPDAAKWMLSVGMLMGRLEFLTVLVVFNRLFWQR